MMEILNAVHNVVAVTPEYLSERHLDGRGICYMKDRDMIAVVGWGNDTKRSGEMVVNYLELSPEEKQKAEEFCLSLGSDCVIRVNEMLKEIARIRREKGEFTMKTDEIRIFPCFAEHPPEPGEDGEQGPVLSGARLF